MDIALQAAHEEADKRAAAVAAVAGLAAAAAAVAAAGAAAVFGHLVFFLVFGQWCSRQKSAAAVRLHSGLLMLQTHAGFVDLTSALCSSSRMSSPLWNWCCCCIGLAPYLVM